MRIFVTGSAGQLGQALTRVFAHEHLYQATHAAADITQRRIIATIMDFKPDVIIHAAAMTDVDVCELQPALAFEVNEQGTRHVAEAARRTGAILVYVSTDYVFDGTKGAPYVETDSPNPINVYGQSKLAGEQAAQEAERWCIVRTSWLYGEGRRNFVTNVLEWASTQPILRLVHDKVGSPTYTNDLAQAIRHVLEAGTSCRVFHAAGGGVCNWVEYGQEILQLARRQKEIQPIAFDALQRPARRPANSALWNVALEEQRFRMRPWQEALQDFMCGRIAGPYEAPS